MNDEQRTKRFTRDWTSIIRRTQFEKVISSTRPGAYVKATNVKAVALALASYADPDGTRVFPGIAMLAADCGLGYTVVARVMVGLRDLGLIERVRMAVRRNPRSERERTDEYQLAIPEDLLERLSVTTPSEHGKRARANAKHHRHTAETTSEPAVPTLPFATSDHADPAGSDVASDHDRGGSEYVSDINLSMPQPTATNTQTITTSTTYHPDEDVSYDATGPRTVDADAEDPNFGVVEATARPSLRVVTGGGRTTPTLPALWPVAVPSPTPIADAPAVPVRPASARQAAIAAMRSNLAAAQQAAKQANRRRSRRTG